MLRYTLVPEDFFSPDASRALLSRVVRVEGKDDVKYKELPQYKAVLVYVANTSTEETAIQSLCEMIAAASVQEKYNRIVARYDNSAGAAPRLDVVLVAGPRLLFVNSFDAPDSVTAQYYIFAALKQFQINPELTVVYFYGDAPFSMKEDLFRYFSAVESL